jgi:signal transduction histidine kinase
MHLMMFKGYASKIMVKVEILSIIQIVFIIIIFGTLVYFQSQQTYLGNSINIAGKNRFLSADLLYKISEYLTQPNPNHDDIDKSQIKTAEQQLESNIMKLREGGNISGIELKPLPLEFTDDWNAVQTKWVALKTAIGDQSFANANAQESVSVDTGRLNQEDNVMPDTSTKQELAPLFYDLINSSDVLVTKLGQAVKSNLDSLVVLQIVFGFLNAMLIVFVLFLVGRILKPVSMLTKATSEIKKGNLLVSVNYKGRDELSTLAESFNSMVVIIKNNIKKQSELANELMQLNAKLKNADTVKDEFINVASHEFRNPIQSIINSIALLTSKIKDGEQKVFLEIAVRNSKKLKTLTQNLLDASKIENNSLNLYKEEFCLNDLVSTTIKEYEENSFNLTFVSIVIRGCGDDVLVHADKNRISQVVSNLIDNSIKFTSNGDAISITIERREIDSVGNNFDKPVVVVSVKDCGEGLDSEILPKLFKKFASKSFQGTGLGLYICKNIVEAHGGQIWAENNKNEKGVTFSFSIPICP